MKKKLSSDCWDRIYKSVVNEKNQSREVRDLQTEFATMRDEKIPFRNWQSESQEDYDLRMKQRRANAFRLNGCLSEIGTQDPETGKIPCEQEIFSLTIEDAIARQFILWTKAFPTLFRALMDWSEDNPIRITEYKTRAFYLCGPHRCGKSLFCKLFAMKLYDNETPENRARSGLVKFVTLQGLISAYIKASPEDKHRMELELLGVKYLFIDDIGNHHGTPWNQTMLIEWLGRRLNGNYRDGKKLWTFFTSNYSIPDLGLDQTLIARISESAKEIKVGPTVKGKQSQALDGNPTYS